MGFQSPRLNGSKSTPCDADDRSSPTAGNGVSHPAEPIDAEDEIPVDVRYAARFLGVSRQTVYNWVERKQIPHFRVMGRNIRFLKSDLEPFRAQFKQEVENGKTSKA